MADIFKAYQFLSDALKLNLTETQMSRAEMFAKVGLAAQQGFKLSAAEAKNVEAFVYFQPREGKALKTADSRKRATAKRPKRDAKAG